MNYLLNVISATAHKDVKFKRSQSNLSDSKKTMSDSTYINQLIGSKPEIKLEEGITYTINWAKQNNIIINLEKWIKSVR
jgi:nucleoside-diphosphate-sugar epimerase